MQNQNSFKSKLENLEKQERERFVRDCWNRITHKKEVLLQAYPDQKLEPDKYYVEMLFKETDPSKLNDRLGLLITLNKQIHKEKVSQKLAGDWNRLDRIRKQYLKDTDWMLLPDAPLEKKQRNDVIKYRKYLRDLPVLIEKQVQTEMKVLTLQEWANSYLKEISNAFN